MRKKDVLITNGIFHVFNRGINSQETFPDDAAFKYFLALVDHCRRFSTPLSLHNKRVKAHGEEHFRLGKGNGKRTSFTVVDIPVEVHAYCLMPNHFHLLLKQLTDGGISWFVKRICDSYTKAFNKRFSRTGPLWEGRFKAKHITDDYSYLQVIRYIHKNPFHSKKLRLDTLLEYPYSSFAEAIAEKPERKICDHRLLRGLISSTNGYKEFVEAEVAPYEKEVLEEIAIEPIFAD